MGGGNFSQDAYRAVTQVRATQPVDATFTQNTAKMVDDSLNPAKMKEGRREARDSADHPESLPIIIALDQTGSMGKMAVQLAIKKLGTLMSLIIGRSYVPHPQICFAAIGDAYTDQAPFQVGQFESDNRMDSDLTKLWLEGGGGGQVHESYGCAHHFASDHTSTDAWEKRGEKGYLFTMGDEMAWSLEKHHREQIFGCSCESPKSIEELIARAQERYHVYHIVIGGTAHGDDPKVMEFWRKLLGERALKLPNSEGVAELVAVTIGLNEGAVDLDDAHHDLVGVGVSADLAHQVTTALTTISGSSAIAKGAVTGDLPTTKGSAGGNARL